MASLRGGLVRLLILAVAAAVVGGAFVAHDYVRPERVREALLATLREKLPGVDVQVESAGLRLLGGISVEGLTLTRPGDAEPFFAAPRATVSHDKESLAQGVVQIRKVEIDGATLRLNRAADGHFDLEGLLPPAPASADLAPIPTVLVKNATVFVTDHRPQPVPPLVLTDVKLHLLNDPVAVLKVEAGFTLAPQTAAGTDPSGFRVPMTVAAKYHRLDKSVTARVEVPELAMVPDLAPAFAKVHPALADYLSQFHATLGIKADVKIEAGLAPKYDVKIDVRDGRFEDENLPWPVEQLTGTVQVKDGKLTVEKATARFGKATVEIALETRSPPPAAGTAPATDTPQVLPPTIGVAAAPDGPLKALEEKIERLQLTVRQLALDDEFFAKLPPKVHRIRRMFSPAGSVDVGVSLVRTPTGVKQELEVRPNRANMNYEKFKYPVQDLGGNVKLVTLPDGTSEFRVQITGTASQRRIELTGRVGSEGPDPLIDLKLTGINFPIDERLFAAMPAKYAASLGKLQAAGRGDFSVQIHQAQGVNRCESTIQVSVHEATINYDYFPYPLRNIRGRVCVRIAAATGDRPLRPELPLAPPVDTDRVEIRNFEAGHADGKLWLDGDSEPVSGTTDRKLTLSVKGENLPFDADFKAAVGTLKVGDLWRAVAPRGTFTFGAEVEIVERGSPPPSATTVLSNAPSRLVVPTSLTTLPGEPPFNPASDLKLAINFKGPTVTPEGFPYVLEELSGVIRYAQGKVDLKSLAAHHGGTALALDAAEIRFGRDGEVWANVGGATVRPLAFDADLLKALPPKAREAVKALKFRGPADLHLKQLVVSFPGTGVSTPVPAVSAGAQIVRGQTPAAANPVAYWEGEVKMHGASFDLGTDFEEVHGTVYSRGRYDGDRWGDVLGNAWLDRATVVRQPVTKLKASYAAAAQQPDPARAGTYAPFVVAFPDLTANAYQGTVGGKGRVALGRPGEDPAFVLELTASGVRLDEFAAQTKLAGTGELRGLAQGKVHLESQADPRTGQPVLTGTGQIDVLNGRLYNLPVLLPLLKLLKLQSPDQTAFEEAHALFELHGDRLRVTQLDLIGTALSLGGSGELDLKGDEVRFEFYTVWSQALRRWLTTPLGDVTSFLSGNLFKIEMVKTPGRAMEYRPQMLPVVIEPMKAVAERLRNRLATAPTDPAPVQRPVPR
jgi:hypothetical protein